jgi:AcrR family transcriptional regulator
MQETRPPGSARERLLAAALELFAEHGVAGTSLQMIADRLGVTKAAVYHQFPTKEEIVTAVINPALERLTAIAEGAEAQRSRAARQHAALAGVVDLVVDYRQVAAVLSFDPFVAQLARRHPAMHTLVRIRGLLTGPDPDVATSVNLAMISGGLMMAGTDPALVGLDDETLRQQLKASAARALRIRVPQRAG